MIQLKRYTTSHGIMCDGADVSDLEKSHADLLKILSELYILVTKKAHNILDEDAANNGFLEVKIIAAIYAEDAS